ncbi:hypothetical protein [Hyphomicrobium sp.]|jgi:hypothetical protein
MPDSAYTMIFAIEGLLIVGAVGTGLMLFYTSRHHRSESKLTNRGK